MMLFGRDRKSDAAAKQQEDAFDLAIAARISEVVSGHAHDDAHEDPPAPSGNPAAAHPAAEPGLLAEAPPRLTETSGAPARHDATTGWGPPMSASYQAAEAAPAYPAQAGSAQSYPTPDPLLAAAHLAPPHVPDPFVPGTVPSASPPELEAVAEHQSFFEPGFSEPAAFAEPQAFHEPHAFHETQASAALQHAPEPQVLPLHAPFGGSRTSAEALTQFAGVPAAGQAAESTSLFAVPKDATPKDDAAAIDALMQQTSMRLRTLGTVNILVAGQTGVGKSTLINSVFGEQFAQTAAGRPVTQQAQWFSSETVPLRILDTRGLEAKDYAITLNDLRAEIEACRAQKDERDQLHMAWVCISSPSSRVQDCEVDIVRVLNKHDIPAIIVLTKDDDDEEFAGIVGGIMQERRAAYTAIVPVRALSKPKRPAAGLEDLVVATFTALPKAHKAAFAAAQKINRDMNKMAAEEYVIAASSAAAAASVIPIPFADMATLAPIQASMLVSVSNAFGLTLERSQIMQLITTILGCLALSVAGGWAVGNLLKFIPGPGSAIGAVLNAGVAGAMTQTLGKAYINFIYTFIERNGRVPTTNEVFEIFPSFYRSGGEE